MKTISLTSFIAVLAVLLFLVGCGSSDTAVTPDGNSSQMADETYAYGTPFIGQYQLALDEQAGSVELVQRDAAWDVTQDFAIRLRGFEWDPVKRLIYAKVELQNLVRTIYYGVRLVFDNTGGRWIVNSDGYDYYEIAPGTPPMKRMPYITYKRDTYHRNFPGPQTDMREICIYCPPGVSVFDFWVDGVQQWEREEPIVEEQFCHKTMAISAWAVTAFCYDFQTHYGDSWGLNDLMVWADLSGVGGPAQAEMFDDGMHFDFDEGDHVYGIDFIPNPSVKFAMITIFAQDSDGNISQNKVAFIRQYTLRDYHTSTIEKGYWSEYEGPHFEVIRDGARWTEFWIEHKGYTEPPYKIPYVNFSIHNVIVDIAGRAGGGESMDIHHVFENTKGKLEVRAATWNGTLGCVLPFLMTNAYDIVKIARNDLAPDHQLRDRLFYCDEQLQFSIVVEGKFSKIRDFREVIVLDWDSWVDLWQEHTGGTTLPPRIDFNTCTVACIFLGDRYLDDTYVEVDRIMDFPSPLRQIYYSEHYPGHGCELAPLDCAPYTMVVFAKQNWANYEFFYRQVPDDCV